MKGLEARLRERFPFDRYPEVVSLYLFGSQAEGSAHSESDVDIGVLVDRSLVPSREDRSELRVRYGSELIAVTGRNEVDLVILNDAPGTVRNRPTRAFKRCATTTPNACR